MAKRTFKKKKPAKDWGIPKKPTSTDPHDRFRTNFSEIGKPEEVVKMPFNISKENSDFLSDVMFGISAWRDFTDDLIYAASRDAVYAQEAHQKLWDLEFIKTSGSTVKEREAKVRANPQIVDLKSKVVNAEMMLEMLQRKYENYTNNIALLSREITRRSNMS